MKTLQTHLEKWLSTKKDLNFIKLLNKIEKEYINISEDPIKLKQLQYEIEQQLWAPQEGMIPDILYSEIFTKARKKEEAAYMEIAKLRFNIGINSIFGITTNIEISGQNYEAPKNQTIIKNFISSNFTEENSFINEKTITILKKLDLVADSLYGILIVAMINLLRKTEDNVTSDLKDKLVIKKSNLLHAIVAYLKAWISWENKKGEQLGGDDFIKYEIDDNKLRSISETCIRLAVSSEIITINEQTNVPTIKITKIMQEYLTEFILTSNLKIPLIQQPIPYPNTKNALLLTGGYLSGSFKEKDLNVSKLLINVDINNSNTFFNIEEAFITNINYLQNQEMKINIDYLNTLLNTTDSDILNELNIELDQLWKFKEEDYNKRTMAQEFIASIAIAKAFQNYTLYLNWNIDGRGRIYNTNTPLGFHKNQAIRNLFKLKKDSNNKVIKLEDDKVKKLNKWELINYKTLGESALIGIDATASIYQIIGGLILDDKLMTLTNVISNERSEKQDIYEYITNKFQESIKEETIRNYYETYISKIGSQKYGYDKVWRFWSFDEIFNEVKNLKRQHLKSSIMTWSYNHGIEDMSRVFLKDNFGDNPALEKLSRLLIAELIKVITREFPDLITLKELLKYIVIKVLDKEKKTHIILNIKDEESYFTQCYRKNKLYKYTIFGPVSKKTKKRIKTNVYEQIKHPEINLNKNKAALMPNLIHYLDSVILQHVITRCRENKIPLIPIHDAFYSNIEYHNIIRNYYKESFFKIIIKKNIIQDILDYNKIEIPTVPNTDDKKRTQNIMKRLIKFLENLKIKKNNITPTLENSLINEKSKILW